MEKFSSVLSLSLSLSPWHSRAGEHVEKFSSVLSLSLSLSLSPWHGRAAEHVEVQWPACCHQVTCAWWGDWKRGYLE